MGRRACKGFGKLFPSTSWEVTAGDVHGALLSPWEGRGGGPPNLIPALSLSRIFHPIGLHQSGCAHEHGANRTRVAWGSPQAGPNRLQLIRSAPRGTSDKPERAWEIPGWPTRAPNRRIKPKAPGSMGRAAPPFRRTNRHRGDARPMPAHIFQPEARGWRGLWNARKRPPLPSSPSGLTRGSMMRGNKESVREGNAAWVPGSSPGKAKEG